MFGEKYQVVEISPSRVLVKNKSFWSYLGKNTVARIVEELSSSRSIISTIPFKNQWNGYDYLIIMKPKE